MRTKGMVFVWCVLGGSCLAASVARETRIFAVKQVVLPPREHPRPGPMAGTMNLEAPFDGSWEDAETFRFDLPSEERDRLFYATVSGDALVDLLKTCVAEDSWSNERNGIHLAGEGLMVIQTLPVLAELDQFIRVLYARSMRRYELAIALVPPAAFAQARGAEAGGRALPPEVFDRARAAGGAETRCALSQVVEGEQMGLRPVHLQSAVLDYDVNYTGSEPASAVIVGGIGQGWSLWSRLVSTPRPDLLQLDFVVSLDQVGTESRTRRIPHGDIELPATGGIALEGATVVPLDRTVVLGELSASAGQPRSFTVLARVRPVAAEPPQPSPVGIVEVGALLRPWPGKAAVRVRPYSAGGNGHDVPGLFEPVELIARMRAALPVEIGRDDRLRLYLAGSGLFVRVQGDAAATERATRSAQATAQRLFEEEGTLVEARFWHGSLDPAALAGAIDPKAGAVLLAEDWRMRLTLARETRIHLTGFGGQEFWLWAADGRRYIAAAEQMSGGTQDVIIEVSDPIVRWAGTGLSIRASALPVPGTPWVQLRVNGSVAATEFKRSLAVRTDRTMAVDRDGTVRPVGAAMDIELPDTNVDRWDHFIAMPVERAALLNSFPDPAEPGKVRALIAEVRLHSPAQ